MSIIKCPECGKSNHYVPTCLATEPWWDEDKNKIVSKFCVIGNESTKTELCISL